MSKQYNNAGREIVVDRVIELKRKSSSNAFTRIQSTITGQQNQVDLDALKDALEGITSDGIISSYEKQGLRREWASLQSSYVSIAEQFTSNPDLSNNASFLQMRLLYTQLKEIMDKVFADMSTDYVGDDVKDITDGFYEIYQLLSVCQTILNGLNDFSRNYTISVSGNREVLSGTQLTAGIYRGGVEQQNPEFIDGNNYTWTRIDDADSFESRNGKTLLLNSDDLPISPCRFSVIWKDYEQQTTLSVVFEVTYGTIVEYAWSNAVTEEELKGLMPGLWSPTVPTKPDDVKYLWRRETSDNRKTYQYFRDTGTEGVSMSSLVPLYAIGESATTAPDSDYESWSITMPARPEGMYLWRVDKITYSDGTIEYTSPIMVTGDSGDIGTAPEYWYKYTKTNDPDAYKGGAALITIHGKAVSIHGTTLVSGMGKWLPYVPQGPQYEDDYLWTMIKHADGTSDIIPPAKQGAPAFDIRIIASQESYQLSSRGVVITEQTFTFTLERWYVTGKANWSVSPDPSTVPDQLSCDADRNQDVFHVTIKKGASLTSFVVSVKCDYMEITRDLTIVGVDGGEESAIYLKVYPLDPNGAKPIFYRDSQTWIKNGSVWPEETPDGEPLITGDYLLYLTEVRQNQSATTGKVEPVPYYFVRGEGVGDAGEWVLLDSDSPYYSEAMGTVLADVVNMPDMPVTVGALYGFFKNFAAEDAVIDSLTANQALIDFIKAQTITTSNITVGNTGGMRVRILSSGPTFDVTYGSKTIFKVYPATGNIFFGEPNSSGSAPSKGFMYRPSDGTLRGPNGRFVIDQNGNLTASNASISGTVNATSGNMQNISISGNSTFAGEVNCDGLRVVPQDGVQITNIAMSGGGGQAAFIIKQIYDALYSDGPSTNYAYISRINGRIFKCSTSNISSSRNISYLYVAATISSAVLLMAYVIMFDSLYRTIPDTALNGTMQSSNGGEPPNGLMLTSMGNVGGITSEDIFEAFTGSYFRPTMGNASVSLSTDYDNVYLNIVDQPSDEMKADMTVGQLYTDENGFVKAITLEEFISAQSANMASALSEMDELVMNSDTALTQELNKDG